jgi:hypothetical protein
VDDVLAADRGEGEQREADRDQAESGGQGNRMPIRITSLSDTRSEQYAITRQAGR